MTTFTERLEAVIAELAQHGITFVLDTSDQTSGDAWVDATEKHGSRLAFVHEEHAYWVDGGISFRNWRGDRITTHHIRVNYHYDHPEDADAIVAAFTNHGFAATWSGDRYESVEVDLSA